jgi:hypothetical protein
MPLNWMQKTEKGPISSFIIERLSEIETIHQYIQGKMNGIPDSCSRYPMLGPKQLAARGFSHCVEEMLKRLPCALKAASVVHFHGGRNNSDLRASLKIWFHHVSALTPLNPPRSGTPPRADVSIMAPRCEVVPVMLATYLLGDVPFALLLPVDLVDVARRPDIFTDAPIQDIAQRLETAGKITILEAQMMWVIGNLPDCRPIETFALRLRTPAPITGTPRPNSGVPEDPYTLADAEGTVPRTIEAWVNAQQTCPEFQALLDTMDDVSISNRFWTGLSLLLAPQTCYIPMLLQSFFRLHWTSWRRPLAFAPPPRWATMRVATEPSRSFGAFGIDACASSLTTTTPDGQHSPLAFVSHRSVPRRPGQKPFCHLPPGRTGGR